MKSADLRGASPVNMDVSDIVKAVVHEQAGSLMMSVRSG